MHKQKNINKFVTIKSVSGAAGRETFLRSHGSRGFASCLCCLLLFRVEHLLVTPF